MPRARKAAPGLSSEPPTCGSCHFWERVPTDRASTDGHCFFMPPTPAVNPDDGSTVTLTAEVPATRRACGFFKPTN